MSKCEYIESVSIQCLVMYRIQSSFFSLSPLFMTLLAMFAVHDGEELFIHNHKQLGLVPRKSLASDYLYDLRDPGPEDGNQKGSRFNKGIRPEEDRPFAIAVETDDSKGHTKQDGYNCGQQNPHAEDVEATQPPLGLGLLYFFGFQCIIQIYRIKRTKLDILE